MADISAKVVMELREQTNAAMMDCKKALIESGGDAEKAKEWLRKKGLATAIKKQDRTANEGIIASYIHLGGKVGVLVEVNCETDFVAKNENFREFVKDITLQIAASNPLYVSREEIHASEIEKEKRIYSESDRVKGKPAAAIENILKGMLDKFYSEKCLLDQPFVKNPDITIKDHVASKTAELGERLIIRRFVRYQVGESTSKNAAQAEAQAATASA